MHIVCSDQPSRAYTSLIWKVFFEEKNRGVSIDKHFPWIKNESDNIYYEAYQESQLVGGITVKSLAVTRSKKVALLGLVVVRQECRGKGIFDYLIRHVISDLETSKFVSIFLWSSQHYLYEKHGFETCDDYLFGTIKRPINNAIEYDKRDFFLDSSTLPIPTFSHELLRNRYKSAVILYSDFSGYNSILHFEGADCDVRVLIHSLAENKCFINVKCNDSILACLRDYKFSLDLESSNLQMQRPISEKININIDVLDRI